MPVTRTQLFEASVDGPYTARLSLVERQNERNNAMAESNKVATAIGQQVVLGKDLAEERQIKIGQPPVVFQTQTFGYVLLERPEELRQWEEDLRSFYGISTDASALAGRACETCSCCSDDCGLLE
jgi:hypothetical protein